MLSISRSCARGQRFGCSYPGFMPLRLNWTKALHRLAQTLEPRLVERLMSTRRAVGATAALRLEMKTACEWSLPTCRRDHSASRTAGRAYPRLPAEEKSERCARERRSCWWTTMNRAFRFGAFCWIRAAIAWWRWGRRGRRWRSWSGRLPGQSTCCWRICCCRRWMGTSWCGGRRCGSRSCGRCWFRGP